MRRTLAGLVLLGSLAAWASMTLSRDGVPIVMPDGPEWHHKIDFAELEHRYPISRDALMKLTPEILATWDQEAIDQFYARLGSGPIPRGFYQGSVLLPPDAGIGKTLASSKLVRAVASREKVEAFMELIWRGTNFYPEQELARNRLDRAQLKRVKFLIRGKLKIPENKAEIEVLPGRLYCGQSLLDSRRESIIIDYRWNSRLPGYREQIDYVVGREAFDARTELRMIRPGFYLGRVALDHTLEFTLILQNQEEAARGDWTDACWNGK
jgi:hypothetical protein